MGVSNDGAWVHQKLMGAFWWAERKFGREDVLKLSLTFSPCLLLCRLLGDFVGYIFHEWNECIYGFVSALLSNAAASAHVLRVSRQSGVQVN